MNMRRIKVPRVWMNVSTSADWSRSPVGIVRVEQELFKALAVSLGKRLIPCTLVNGTFVAYSGTLGLAQAAYVEEADQPFVWPDPSYEFPQSISLDPARIARSRASQEGKKSFVESRPVEIEFGDVLISVGLDWELENKGLTSILYELKTYWDVKVITCCYDLIPVLFPQYCVGDVAAKFREYFTNQTWSSSGMLCISKCSETDYRALATELGMPRIPTKVMLLGNKLLEMGDISDEIKALCAKRYVLYVSTIERRKNHEILYKALHILAERRQLDPDFKLVFLGMPGWGVADLLKDIELDPLVKDHIVQLNYANDSELRRLYESCEFFVYPSFYEGWGLPVAEALALGKFVIASSRGSIPEVGGDLVEYADPWNASAWAEILLKYWGYPDLVRARAEKVRLNYRPIHWEETASAVLELIEMVETERLNQINLEPGYDMLTIDGLPYGPRIVMAATGGTLCYGPYRPLPQGPVHVAVEFEKLGTDPIDLSIEFCSEGGKKVHKIVHHQLAGAKTSTRLQFNLDLEFGVEEFEIVVRCPGIANISLDSAIISYGG